MAKDKGPLQTAQREGDALKKEVDQFLGQCQNYLEDPSAGQKKKKELYKKSDELKKKVEKQKKKVSKLNKGKEPVHDDKFDQKKAQEESRMNKLLDQLSKVRQKLEPDKVEEDYLSKAKSGKDVAAEQNDDEEEEEEDSEEDEGEEEEDEEEGEEEEDEYEDEEEEEEESEEEQDTPVKAKSKKTVAPQEESDEYEDDEEEEEEEEEEGEEEEEEEDSEESEDEFERPAEISSDDDADFLDEGMKQFEAVCDFVAEQNEDLGFKVGDNLTILDTREDGWWVAEDEEGRRGLVPSTYLKLKKDYSDHRDLQSPEQPQSPDPETPRSGKMLWKGLKAAVTETSVTDVLTAMGAIPAGFRPSTTAKYVNDPKHTTGYYLLPKLSKSKMWFSDLHWQPKENQVRSRAVRVQRMISLWGVRNMSKIGVGLEILSRHVRICMFDGDKVLSNVHTVRATTTGPDGKEWRFSPKVTGILPSLMDGECFVRSNHTQQKLGILFELCLSYIRSKTGERGEFSCGWHHLPLFDEETGGPIFSKNYELTVHGGTPYEQDVEVDPSISRKASTSKIRAMMSANKQPRLVVKILAPTKDQKQLLDQLPDTIVSSTGYLTFLSYFRKLLADVLLRDRINMETADLIHHPVLASFPEAVKYPDIMDALRSTWADKMKNVKKADKRDNEHMKDFFCQIFMETCYPLLHSPTLATPKWADAAVDNARWEEIAAFLKKNREQAGVLTQLLSPDTMHQPFDTKEVTFDLLSGYQGYR
ncbi:nephrocystin-1-like [Glandiceps talaboti]